MTSLHCRPEGDPRCARRPANIPGLATVRAPYFIGRAEPLSRLRRAWDLACSGKRPVVWITGEPGIGKTTLTGPRPSVGACCCLVEHLDCIVAYTGDTHGQDGDGVARTDPQSTYSLDLATLV